MAFANQPTSPWSASWIWYPGARWTVNFHLLARRLFELNEPVLRASLRISANTDYKLHVNGAYLGRGPVPADPRYQSYDTYEVANYLKSGANVMGIIAHNYGVGVHWQYRGPGGLLAQLDIETAAGAWSIETDDSWRVSKAHCYRPDSPRMSFSNGFMETFDFHDYEDCWLEDSFHDSGWETPEVIGPHITKPWTGLAPREIPLLEENPVKSAFIEKGRFTAAAVHAVRFAGVMSPGENKLGYAQTWFHSEQECEIGLIAECDDAIKVFINNRLAIEQNYSEEFSRTRVWRGNDEYEQVHYGMYETYAGLRARVRLKAGWNKVLAVVDQGPQGWGFALAFVDSETMKSAIDLDFGSDRKGNRMWITTAGPDSTGMSDSLDNVRSFGISAALKSRNTVAAASKLLCDPFDHTQVTDYGLLMRLQERHGMRSLPPETARLELREGGVCIIALERIWVTYPEFTITSDGDGILDIGYSQILPEDRSIGFSNDDRMKYVDRVYLRDGKQTWQPLQRRTARYMHICCRKGRKVEISGVRVNAVGYPVREIAEFECSDAVLNQIWDVSRHTTRLLMQYGYQDCLKREEGAHNTSSFNFMSRAAGCCFGDYALARKTLKWALQTQDDTGWFHAHGISSPSSDEPTQCLWWMVWLNDYYVYSGDIEFVTEVWENLEDNLRYFGKATNKHGLIDGRDFAVFRQGQYVYIDDSTNSGNYVGYFGGELLGYNILYYAGLKAAAHLAEALGLSERAAFHNAKAERVRASTNRRFWNERLNRYADWRKGNRLADTGHAAFQIAAVYFGLPEFRHRAVLLKYLRDDVGLPDEDNTSYPLHTFGFFYYLLELWFRNGSDAMATEFMRRFYGKWIEMGGTAFGEGFWLPAVKGEKQIPFEYEVHGYGAGAHLHFYTNLLGICPLEPGFERILISPRPGDVKWAKGRIATPRGVVGVSWKANGSRFDIEVTTPETCSCEFDLPLAYEKHVAVLNGREVKS